MKFSIGQVSKLTGFSVSGIRYYEQAGVISPMRGTNGKYRDFSMHELQLLLTCKHYRDCGFTLAESVELLNKSGVHQVKEQLAIQASKLKQVITRNQLLYELVTQKEKDIDCLFNKKPCVEIASLPAFYRFKLWQPGASENSCMPDDEVHHWLRLAPFTNSSLMLSAEDFCNGKGELPTDWGLAIDERFVSGLALQTAPHGVYFPSCECVHTVVAVSEDLCISSSQLESARKYMTQNQLTISGPVITRLFYLSNFNDRFQRFDELWIPVEHII